MSQGVRRSRRRHGIVLVTIAGLALAVGLAATANARSNGVVIPATANAAIAAATIPKSMGLPVHTKPIPRGKTVTYVHCGVPVCTTIANAIRNAATILGWKLKVVPSDGSPASIKAAWATVVRLKPNAAFGSGHNATVYASELEQLAKLKIPVFAYATTDTPTPGLTMVRGDATEVGIVGIQEAAWAVRATGGKARTVYVDLPTFPILAPVGVGYQNAINKWCPNTCTFDKLNVPIDAIGSTAPSQIVSYLRANPDVNVVALSYDGVGIGLPAALKAAGLDTKVKIVGEAPTSINLGYVQDGTQGATVSQGYYEIWANFVDAAARVMTGQSIAPNKKWKVPWFLVTKANLAKVGDGNRAVMPNLNAQLRKIWNKKK